MIVTDLACPECGISAWRIALNERTLNDRVNEYPINTVVLKLTCRQCKGYFKTTSRSLEWVKPEAEAY